MSVRDFCPGLSSTNAMNCLRAAPIVAGLGACCAPTVLSGSDLIGTIGMSRSIAHCAECIPRFFRRYWTARSEEHTSELQSLMRPLYAVFCLPKKNKFYIHPLRNTTSQFILTYSLHRTTTIQLY